MNRPSILVSRTLPSAVEARAARDYDARLNPDDRPIAREAWRDRAAGCQAVLCTVTDKVDAGVIASLPESVRAIATFSVGFSHIDVAAAAARGIVVTNTPDVLTDATADIALLLLLGAARRAAEGEALIRSGGWTGWAPTQMLGTHLGGKRLGILGMGRIGIALARRARALGMTIHYLGRRRRDDLDFPAIFHADAESFWPVCDALSLHTPLTAQTRGILGAAALAALPRGAIVVNTARGELVDDDALIAALASGQVAAAGLDVFTGEPAVDPRYVALANSFLLPHLGSATVETRNAMGFRALDNLDAFFAGREPADRVA